MTLNLNTVYTLMNTLIRGTTSTNINKQLLAINEGYKYLNQRMIEKGRGIEELLSAPTNVATTVNVNYVSLPTDFVAIETMFYLSGTKYIPFETLASKSYKDLIRQTNERFFDTTDTGIPTMYAIKRPYIYFDFHAPATSSAGIKLIYYKRPTTLVAYDRLVVSGASGDFTVGESITSGSTEESATVYAIGTNYIDVLTTSRTGTFSAGETLTGGTSSETATYVSMTEKPQELEISENYSLALATSAATTYLFMEDSPEAAAKNATLEGLLDNMIIMDKNNVDLMVRLA